MAQYHIELDNGNNGATGANATTNAATGAWLTIDNFTENARNAGDIATIRRGTTQPAAGDLAFTSDGTILNPIVFEADYDDFWGDEATASETATLSFASKTIGFTGDISAEITTGSWIYETSENNRDYSYEVASINTRTIGLYLPYKGNQAGAGKTIEIMPASPIWNDAAGGNQVIFTTDNYWKAQGVAFHSTDVAGVLTIDSCTGHVFRDCTFWQQNGTRIVLNMTDDMVHSWVHKSRIHGGAQGLGASGGLAGLRMLFSDCLFDGLNNANSGGYVPGEYDNVEFRDCEFQNYALGDIVHTNSLVAYGATIKGRNVLLNSVTPIDQNQLGGWLEFKFSDHQGVPGAAENYNSLGDTEGTPNFQSTVGTLRTNGSLVSIQVNPSTELSTNWKYSWLELFEQSLRLATTGAHTAEIYVRTETTGNWTATPSASELWIEAEFYSHTSNAHRELIKSTTTVGFDASIAWKPLSVTFTPAQPGVAFLRCYYAKTKEGGKSNVFFVDPLPVMT